MEKGTKINREFRWQPNSVRQKLDQKQKTEKYDDYAKELNINTVNPIWK